MENREIKFRAWHKEEKQMLQKIKALYFDKDGLRGWAAIYIEGKERGEGNFQPGEVEIMQYTGLKDKNGKEIYEGDIIEYLGYDGKKYKQKCPNLTAFHFWQETEDNETVLVIGNIYENQELLIN